MVDEAEGELSMAATQGRAGRFQLEAALQSAHVEGARRGRTDWKAIAVLYDGLVRLAPTTGALVGRAAALAEAIDPASGLRALDAIDPETTRNYQPYWAVRAHLLHRAGRTGGALDAFDRAIGLTEDASTRQFLLERRAEVREVTSPARPAHN
jgi:RNA polymerase sigma-70 factor (ECF subfamily)